MKLSKQELQSLDNLKTNKDNFLIELGQIKYNELLLDERNDKAIDFLDKLRDQELAIMKSLEDKYGKGAINVQTGEFTPE